MIKIYHNTRCSKSRAGLKILEESGQNFEVITYLNTPLTKEELGDILTILQISPLELVRKNEKIWKEQYKGKDLSEDQIIESMVQNPKLIERPIVIKGNQGVIGRPPENIKDLI